MGLISGLKKEIKLQKIMKALGSPRGPDEMIAILRGAPDYEPKARKELYDLVYNNSYTRAVMNDHGITKDDLDELYNQIILNCGAQWVRRYWLPASAIAYPQTLDFVLTEANKPLEPPMQNSERWMYIISTLIDYFEK